MVVSGNCMKHWLNFITIVLLCSCKSSSPDNNCLVPIDDDTTSNNIGKTVDFDSAQFKVHRLFFESGQLSYESYTDTIIGLRHERDFHHDGRLASDGMMNAKGNFHIGKWRYFSHMGETTTIDFDSAKQVSYYKAIQLAKTHGQNQGRLEISEELIGGTYYWKVTHWTEEHTGEGKGVYLTIQRCNGAVTLGDSIAYIE